MPAFFMLSMLFFIFSCSKNKTETIDAVEDRAEIPSLRAYEITTIISDSGVTRYRINTKVWDVYDKADPPYWEFPKGIHLERFDTDLSVDANIKSDYAKYFEGDELWFLSGNVDATNLEGERFETERLYWNQKEEKIYSDTIVKITQKTGVIYGDDFVSNQSLSNYQIKSGRGDFIVNDEE